MTLCSPGDKPEDDVYVGPYYAMINWVQKAVICDDFTDDSYVPEVWTATVTSFSALPSTSVMFGDRTTIPVYGEGHTTLSQHTKPTKPRLGWRSSWRSPRIQAPGACQ